MAALLAVSVQSVGQVASAQEKRTVSISGFANGSSALSQSMKTKALNFVKKNRGYKTATCVGYADKTGTAAINQRLAVARANAVCSLINGNGGISKVKAVGKWNSTQSGGNIRRVEIRLSDPRGGGGGGGTPACEDIDPWPDFESQNWIVYADQTMYAGDEWLTDTYVSGDWGIVIRQRDDPNTPNWPTELYGACVVSSDIVLEYTPDSGTTWNLFDNSYLQTIKPGGSTETLAYNAFNLNPTRYPSSYFTNSRYHWTVTTHFQTWDYYSYLTDRVPVWIDVDYDAVTPTGATNVFVQYFDPDTNNQLTAYVTPGTPLQLTVKRGTLFFICAPDDASVSYSMTSSEGQTNVSAGASTGVGAGFTGWTTTNGIGWQWTVDAESVYNLTSTPAGP